jgi:hypothetical protein
MVSAAHTALIYHGEPGQIGHGQRLHAYLRDLSLVWGECFRVHGFDYLGSIWRKKTTMNTSGGATVMGSYPYPPNGIVEIDFEYILLFKKPGTLNKRETALKKSAAMSRDEWKSWFSGHWELGGARKKNHEAPFPAEIPRRLIRMFSFPGDTVLDPFLGTGTTAEAARAGSPKVDGTWKPRVPDLAPVEGGPAPRATPTMYTVVSVDPDCSIMLDSGMRVLLFDLHISDRAGALSYLTQRVLKKKVFLMDAQPAGGSTVRARVLLKNRISVNAQLVKSGVAARVMGTGR